MNFNTLIAKAAEMVSAEVIRSTSPTPNKAGMAVVRSKEQAITLASALSCSEISASSFSRNGIHYVMVG